MKLTRGHFIQSVSLASLEVASPGNDRINATFGGDINRNDVEPGYRTSAPVTAAAGKSFTIQKLQGGKSYQVRVLASKDNMFEAPPIPKRLAICPNAGFT